MFHLPLLRYFAIISLPLCVYEQVHGLPSFSPQSLQFLAISLYHLPPSKITPNRWTLRVCIHLQFNLVPPPPLGYLHNFFLFAKCPFTHIWYFKSHIDFFWTSHLCILIVSRIKKVWQGPSVLTKQGVIGVDLGFFIIGFS